MTAMVEIRVDSWSSPTERQHLIETMVEKGPDTLLRELQKTKSHGRFSIPGLRGPDPHQLRLGHDLHYAHQVVDPDGGRRIVIATVGGELEPVRASMRDPQSAAEEGRFERHCPRQHALAKTPVVRATALEAALLIKPPALPGVSDSLSNLLFCQGMFPDSL